MHIIFVIVGCIVIVAYLVSDFRKKDAVTRAEGLAPLSSGQQKAARRAARLGKPYNPQRRPYGTPAKFRSGQKRF